MKNKSGFTLLELLVTIGISALIMAGLGSIFAGTLTVWSSVQDSGIALENGRLALEWLTRDIRAKTITVALPTAITFQDGTRYRLQGSNLRRNTILLAENIDSLTISYDDPSNPTFVSITITIDKERGGTLELQDGAAVRNL